MSYHLKNRGLALAGDMAHGPRWYTAMGSVASQPPRGRLPRRKRSLGSLGGDEGTGGNTLSTPTLTDPATVQWQNDVIGQLRAGVLTMQTAELQKWLQIAATLSIPLAAAVWRMIFKKGADPTV